MTKIMCFICLMSFLVYSPKATTTHLEKAEQVLLNKSMLASMIKKIQPNLSATRTKKLAEDIYKNSINFGVDPKIVIAIIATESNFRNNVTSNTGDFSMAQINERIWNKEFSRMGIPTLDRHLLKHNENYVLYKMTKILSILQKRYKKNDANWYAAYHSQTPHLKKIYSVKLNKQLKQMKLVAMD